MQFRIEKPPMHQFLSKIEVHELETMYFKEVEKLKTKLTNGTVLRDIKKQQKKAMKLALAIHHRQTTYHSISLNNLSLKQH